jgi:hypothetical protein
MGTSASVELPPQLVARRVWGNPALRGALQSTHSIDHNSNNGVMR